MGSRTHSMPILREWVDDDFLLRARVDSGTVSLFALTSDLTNSETVAATL